MILALLVVLADSVITVPTAYWRAVAVKVAENDTTVNCSFDVRSEGVKVQALLIERSQIERFRLGRSINPLYVTGLETSARFRQRIPDAGDYILVLDNRLEGRSPAEVALRIELSSPHSSIVREVPPERRRAIVALSLVFFGAVVVFSARQFLKHAT
jgi:hypothetical protein